MKRVFLSYSTPIRKDQKRILEIIHKAIVDNSFECITVSNFSDTTTNPIVPIMDRISTCDLFVCISFEKYYNYQNAKKQYFSSHWLDIETALAFHNKLPIYIMKEEHLVNSEILNNNYKTFAIHKIKTTFSIEKHRIDDKYFEQHIYHQFVEWLLNHS